jgi:cellobiose phosphorylase
MVQFKESIFGLRPWVMQQSQVRRGQNHISAAHVWKDDKAEVVVPLRTAFPFGNFLGLLGGGIVGTTQVTVLTDQRGDGDVFAKQAPADCKLTAMGMSSGFPAENGPNYFYLSETNPQTGEKTRWNAGYTPLREPLDRGESVVGQGYQVIKAEKNKIETQMTAFVPLHDDCVVRVLEITNNSNEPRTIEATSFVPFLRWNPGNHDRNWQRELNITMTEGDRRENEATVYHTTRFYERGNRYAYAHDYAPADYVCHELWRWAGVDGSIERPDALFDPEFVPDEKEASENQPISAMKHTYTIEPGKSVKLVSLIGFHEFTDPTQKFGKDGKANKAPAHELIEKYRSFETIDQEFAAMREAYNGIRSKMQVRTPDDNFNRIVNVWNPYQLLMNALVSRGKSFGDTEGRGMGNRDSNQDSIALASVVPNSWVKGRIKDLFGIHDTTGRMSHQYNPLTKAGDDRIGSNFSDDALWGTLSVAQYCKETGDHLFLDDLVGFQSDPKHPDLPKEKIPAQSVLDHLRLSMQSVLDRRGPHGLPLILRADWNDCMNLNAHLRPDEDNWQGGTNGPSDVAESVLTAGLFVYSAKLLRDMLLWKANNTVGNAADGLRLEAAHWDRAAERMDKDVQACAWDETIGGGKHFIRAFDEKGKVVGSNFNEEGKIFADGNVWAILGGIGAEKGMPRQALESVKERLWSKWGIELNTPAYSIGNYGRFGGAEVMSYPPGRKENAGVFWHINAKAVKAAADLGDADFAYDIFKAMNPAYNTDAELVWRRVEPYATHQVSAGPQAKEPGKGNNQLLSGTAAWSYVSATQAIMGVRPEFAGLAIDPSLPKAWREQSKVVTAQRKFRGDLFNIVIHTNPTVAKGVKKMVVDGQRIEGNVIPDSVIKGDGTEHLVEVTMG